MARTLIKKDVTSVTRKLNDAERFDRAIQAADLQDDLSEAEDFAKTESKRLKDKVDSIKKHLKDTLQAVKTGREVVHFAEVDREFDFDAGEVRTIYDGQVVAKRLMEPEEKKLAGTITEPFQSTKLHAVTDQEIEHVFHEESSRKRKKDVIAG